MGERLPGEKLMILTLAWSTKLPQGSGTAVGLPVTGGIGGRSGAGGMVGISRSVRITQAGGAAQKVGAWVPV